MPDKKKVLIYGAEQVGLTALAGTFETKNTVITNVRLGSEEHFQDYDGVVVFQGTFETFHPIREPFFEANFTHSHEREDMDQRKKEVEILLEKGGFLCFILHTPFIDSDGRVDYKETDLSKHRLNVAKIRRETFKNRATHLQANVNEFSNFIKHHGAAESYFNIYNDSADTDTLATVDDSTAVGLVIERREYFIPSLPPKNAYEYLKKYFEALVEPVQAAHAKLSVTLPEWLNEYRFAKEEALIGEKEALELQLQSIEENILRFEHFKSILMYSSDDLIEAVTAVFSEGFCIDVDDIDEFREDIKLVDNDKAWCLCEVKGVNKGISREAINQVDSHRDRSGYPEEFPGLLIMNTNINKSHSIEDKDLRVDSEQVKHAVKQNVLIIRTLDLLHLLELYLTDRITKEELVEVFTTKHGWLKCTPEGYTINTE